MDRIFNSIEKLYPDLWHPDPKGPSFEFNKIKKWGDRSIANRASFPYNGRRMKIKQLRLQSVSLGSWNFFLLDLSEKVEDVDGLLGMDFFKKFAICIDFQDQKIYLGQTD